MAMEKDIFCTSLPIIDQNPTALDEASLSVLFQSNALGNNSQRFAMVGYPLFSTLQEDAISSLHISNSDSMVNSEMPISRSMPLECSTYGNTDMQEHLVTNSLSASSFVNLPLESPSLQEHVIGAAISSTSVMPPNEIRTFISNNGSNTLNSSFSASVNCAYGAEDGIDLLGPGRYLNMSGQLNFSGNCDKSMGNQVLPSRKLATVRPSYHVISDSDASCISNKSTLNEAYAYSTPGNKLSPTLGSSQCTIMNMPSIPNQISEISCSGITQVSSNCPNATELQACSHILQHSSSNVDTGMGSRLPIPRNEGLSLNCDSSVPIHFSHVLLGSKYMHVLQHVLAEVASYAVENLNELDESSTWIGSETRLSFSSGYSGDKRTSSTSSEKFPQSSGEIRSLGHVELPFQRDEPKTKKSELITMLQMIDHGYNKCTEQMHNIISEFHAATSFGVLQLPALFALRAISRLYKNLREGITSQILSISQHLNSGCITGKEKSFESTFIEKQWTLQQLRRNDQQSWRPQRGLPEKSALVLRAWMFQNFLHPYPKDNEKHLLAMRSGLTRSQVSNWFINARVRLWKPMIEEMYSEISRKNQTQEGRGDHRRGADTAGQRIG